MKAQNDLTIGKPIRGIILFTLPIIAGNIFQQLYNVVDTVIVGHVLGEGALAAVGATSALYGLFLSIAHGMTNGFSIIIARYFGAKDERAMKSAMAHTIMLSFLITLFLTVVGVLFVKPVLIFLQTPEEILGQAHLYILVILSCFLITVTYNMFSGILRGIGNSVMPLVFLIVSSVINVILDIVLVKFLEIGIVGAAIATVIAQLISAILCIIYIVKKCPLLHVEREDFRWNKAMANELFTMGLSMAMMFSVVSIGSIALQSSINSLGTITIAAHTSARKIGEMMMLAYTPLSVASSTFASQNLGAGKYERIKEGIRAAFAVAFGIAILFIIITYLGAGQLVHLISGSDNQQLISTAVLYLKINLPFYFALATLCILRSTLQGLGRKITPLVASTIELAGKFVVAGLLVPKIGYMGICICEPVIWILGSIIVLADFLKTMKKFLK